MEGEYLRWYCNECKKQLEVKLTTEFKDKFLKVADFFPYPIIFAHENHFSILHVDSNFKDRGSVVSKFLVNLEGNEIQITDFKKKISSKK